MANGRIVERKLRRDEPVAVLPGNLPTIWPKKEKTMK
jgi:hypothetical protein